MPRSIEPPIFIKAGRFDVASAPAMELLLERQAERLNALAEKFAEDCAAIQADRMLSDEGKKLAMRDKAHEVRAALRVEGGHITVLRTRAAEADTYLQHALGKQKFTTGNPMEDAMRAHELRIRLAGMDPVEREALFRRASAQGDMELVGVMENAPSLLGLVTPEVVAAERERRAVTIDPEAARMRGDHEHLARLFEANVQTTAKWLDETAGADSVADHIAAVARGDKNATLTGFVTPPAACDNEGRKE